LTEFTEEIKENLKITSLSGEIRNGKLQNKEPVQNINHYEIIPLKQPVNQT